MITDDAILNLKELASDITHSLTGIIESNSNTREEFYASINVTLSMVVAAITHILGKNFNKSHEDILIELNTSVKEFLEEHKKNSSH